MNKVASLIFCFLSFTINAQVKKYTLLECVNIALEKNIRIQQSEFDLEGADIDKGDAIGNFLPRINAQSQHIWNNGLSQNITNGLIENLTTQFSSFGGNLGVTLFSGKQNINQLARANLNIISRQYQLEDMKDDISLFVANSYLQVMFNKEFEQVQRYQLEIAKQELERTQLRISAGVQTQAEIYEIEANLASQEQALVQSENATRLSLISLAQSLLITDYENFDIADVNFNVPLSQILLEKPKKIFEKSLTLRNDIKVAATNIEIAKTDIDLAKGALLPTLSAFYNYNTRISYSDRFIETGNFIETPIGVVKENGSLVVTQFPERAITDPLSFGDQFRQNDGHSYGLALNIPIFNGLSIKNNIKRRKLNLKRSETQFEQTKLDLENTINQAYNNAEGAFKFYEASEKTLKARKEAYFIAEKQFEAGVLNSYDFIQIKQRYDIAASDNVRAKYDYIFKLKVLEFYFGVEIAI
jgi:outer membrane protein|tara:strand:- start:331 stop:1746 length:1416 start_codon:yes stop_codon:yes gene_type:complete